MSNRYLRYFIILISFVPSVTWAQINMNFVPAVYGKSIDGLSSVQFISALSAVADGNAIIRVNDRSGKNIVFITTPPFSIRPGVNQLPRQVYMNSQFSFAHDETGAVVENTGRFPEAELEYCFEIHINPSKDPSSVQVYGNCFSTRNQPSTPLYLVNPMDGEEICSLKPNLTWQAPSPLTRDMRFRLILVELKDDQDPIEAVAYNHPLINQANLTGNNLPYPASAPDITLGKKYAWQVTAYEGAAVISKSEVWVFVAKCGEEKKKGDADAYRELKELSDGSFYVATQILRFSFNNPYAEGSLNYSLTSLTKPRTVFNNLPELKSFPGLNKYDLDLETIKNMQTGHQYLLSVKLSNGKQLLLTFTYIKE